MSKAFSAVFQRMVHRAWPLPVGSSDMIAMWTHFNAAFSFGKCPRALTARRIRALTYSIAFVVQTMRRISVYVWMRGRRSTEESEAAEAVA